MKSNLDNHTADMAASSHVRLVVHYAVDKAGGWVDMLVST